MKEQLQNYLIEKFNEFKIQVLLLDENQVYHSNTRATCIRLDEYGEHRLYLDIMSDFSYGTINFTSAHIDRLMGLFEIKNNDSFSLDKFVGYVTTDDRVIINGEEVAKGRLQQYVMINNKTYVNTGYNRWKKCSECGKIIFDETKQHEVNCYYLCDDCFNNDSIKETCALCGKKHFSFEMRNIYVHDKDFRKQIENKFNIKIPENDNKLRLALECFNDYFISCSYCGVTKLKEADENACKCRNRRVYDYSYKPSRPRFLATTKPKRNTLFIGFENECEIDTDRYDRTSPCENCDCNPDTCGGCDEEGSYDIDYSEFVKSLTSVLGSTIYCKWDGSLEHGFEIISEPMTYDYILKHKNKFKEAFKKIIDLGAYSYNADTTGFHIHLSRQAFINKEHLSKFAYIIHADKDLSEKIAKRSNNTYGYIREFRDKNKLKEYIERSIGTPEDRYQAVNFYNRNTVEVRIYKGNLNIESVMLYIQHVVSIFNYTALTVKQHTNVSIDNYIKYVYNRGSKFGELKKEIKRIRGDK